MTNYLERYRQHKACAARAGLSIRAFNALRNYEPELTEITTLSVSTISIADLRRQPNVGKVTVTEILEWLKRDGYHLKRTCPYCGGTLND